VEAPTAEPLRGAPVPGSLAEAEARAAMAADLDANARAVEPSGDEPAGKVLPQSGVEGGM
jgi:hypothetical protein